MFLDGIHRIISNRKFYIVQIQLSSNHQRGDDMPVQDFIQFAQGEVLVKEYRALRIRKPQRLEGNIAVTTKRVILYGKATGMGKSQLSMDIHIDKVKGTDIFSESRPRWGLVFIGILLFLFGAAPLMLLGIPNQTELGIILSIIGLILIVLGFLFPERTFALAIKAENLPSLEISRERYSEVRQGPDADDMLREIGALILDVQLQGEAILKDIDFRYLKKKAEGAKKPQDMGAL